MLVNYERAWLRLKEEIVRKRSHGQRDLLTEMARIEIECAVEGEEGFDPTPLPTKPASSQTRASAANGTH